MIRPCVPATGTNLHVRHETTMTFSRLSSACALASTSCWTGGCDFDTALSPRIHVPVVVDSGGLRPSQTDLGYTIALTRLRVVIDTIEMTTEGEQHAALWPLRGLGELLVPTARAHPGHDAGGEILGELRGRFVVDWLDDGALLGEAELLHARYTGVNFTFTQAQASDGIPEGDPLLGHTIDVAGTATRNGHTWAFDAIVDQDAGRRMVGGVFEHDVDEGSDDLVLGLRVLLEDPFEDDDLFDGVEFAALDEDGDGRVTLIPETDPWNRVRRALQVHDHYALVARTD